MTESEFLHHEPCPNCGSSDNLGRYTDGHAWCFGCGHHEKGEGVSSRPHLSTHGRETRVSDLIPAGEVRPLQKREISQETCAKFGYTVGTLGGKTVQIAPYFDENGSLVAQHIRFPNKEFVWLGDAKAAVMFGQHLWRDGGRRVIVTEGEIDALSISQLQSNKWPVVSIGCGAAKPEHTAKITKYIGRHVKWLEKFDEVIFAFDMDEQGRASAKAAAMCLSPGKAKIASYPLHDANDMLVAGRGEELINCLWGAKEFRPDGLLKISDIIERALTAPEFGSSYPWQRLTDLTYGMRPGQLIAWGAGTGAGKTDVLMQVVAHIMQCGTDKVGLFMFENDPAETARYVASKIDGKLYNHPGANWTKDELRQRLEWMDAQNRLMVYDNWGTTDWEEVKTHVRYLVKSWDCSSVIIDHITAFSARSDDERREIEKLMADMAMLAQELRIVIHVVSHLSRTEGKSHEEGGRVTIRNFKGSSSIGFWSHVIFGLERNQQADDPEERQTATLRILKCRPRGSSTGSCIFIKYDPATGLYQEVVDNPFNTPNDDKPENPF
jgi:twinkle protein